MQTKYQELGPVTSEQKRAAILMLVTLILLATDKLHGVAAAGAHRRHLCGLPPPASGSSTAPSSARSTSRPSPFFIMGCMTIGSAGGFPQGDHVDRQQHPALSARHDHHNRRPGLLCARRAGQLPLDPARGHHDHDVSVTELGIQMNMDPRILFYSFQYGLDNYLFPYEYAVILYFFSSGYMLFKDMLKVLAARMVLTGIFLFFSPSLTGRWFCKIPPRVSPGGPRSTLRPEERRKAPRKCRARPKEKERLHVQAYLIGYGLLSLFMLSAPASAYEAITGPLGLLAYDKGQRPTTATRCSRRTQRFLHGLWTKIRIQVTERPTSSIWKQPNIVHTWKHDHPAFMRNCFPTGTCSARRRSPAAP